MPADRLIRRIRAAGLLTATALFPFSARAAQDALEAAAEYNYAKAFSLYCEAADRGDRHAQRTCGLMAWYGEALYGDQVHRDLQRTRKYLEMAAAQGCEVSRYMLGRLDLSEDRPRKPLMAAGGAMLKP